MRCGVARAASRVRKQPRANTSRHDESHHMNDTTDPRSVDPREHDVFARSRIPGHTRVTLLHIGAQHTRVLTGGDVQPDAAASHGAAGHAGRPRGRRGTAHRARVHASPRLRVDHRPRRGRRDARRKSFGASLGQRIRQQVVARAGDCWALCRSDHQGCRTAAAAPASRSPTVVNTRLKASLME